MSSISPSLTTWAATVQKVVTAIRNVGANSQIITLPGTIYASAGAFVSSGSAAALSTIKNPNGSITNLIYDIHQYLDSDYSGTHAECVTDVSPGPASVVCAVDGNGLVTSRRQNVSGAFSPLATYLRQNGRQAFLTETGGGNVASCIQYLCSQNTFIRNNPDVYLGYMGWAAGSFGSENSFYPLF